MQIKKKGIIKKGLYKGWKIVVEGSDEEGYLVLYIDKEKSYDDYFEDYNIMIDDLKQFDIEWLEEE